MVPLVVYGLVGATIFAIAFRLARFADAIADATGIGRIWIGTVLLAASTSLPELTTDVNAALLGEIDIGVGDLMGSTLANMLVLALLDLGYARRRVLDNVSPDHALSGALAIVLTAIAGVAIAAGGLGSIGPVGVETLVIAAIYLVGMRAVYGHSVSVTAPPEQLQLGESSRTLLWRGVRGFALATVGLALTSPLLVLTASAIATEGGVTETFIGTLLVGFTTSFPEIAATIAAVRIGALDLAVGNIFGSNAFNMCVLLGMDLAYGSGPVLAHASKDHLLSAQLAVLAIGFGILAMLARRSRRLGPVRIESVLVVLTYLGAVWLLAR
jgi:cation:H+ antiporter